MMVRKTGATARIEPGLFVEVFAWMRFHLVVRLRMAWNSVVGRRGPAIWFAPDHARPWYMVRTVMAWAGMRVAPSLAGADIVMHFEDATWTSALDRPAMPVINGACLDISKSFVADRFLDAFGYPLAVDPTATIGPAVEKSEVNSMHDGHVVRCPVQPRPGFHYQHLVETGGEDHIQDLRTHIADGRPLVVWRKTRDIRHRFESIANRSVEMLSPEQVYSADELARIADFSARMGLDWGTLDILRCRHTGRIYIVDVNKTDVGPVLVLSLFDKIRTCRLLAAAFTQMVTRMRAEGCKTLRSAA